MSILRVPTPTPSATNKTYVCLWRHRQPDSGVAMSIKRCCLAPSTAVSNLEKHALSRRECVASALSPAQTTNFVVPRRFTRLGIGSRNGVPRNASFQPEELGGESVDVLRVRPDDRLRGGGRKSCVMSRLPAAVSSSHLLDWRTLEYSFRRPGSSGFTTICSALNMRFVSCGRWTERDKDGCHIRHEDGCLRGSGRAGVAWE